MEMQTLAPLPESLSLPPGIADAAGSDEAIRERIHRLAEDVVVTVTPQTVTGRRLQDDRGIIAEHDVHEYDPDPDALGTALWQLEKAGFRIHRRGRFAITVSAPAGLIRDLLQVPLSVQRRPLRLGATAAEKFAVANERPNPAELFVAPPNLSVPAKNMAMDHFVFIPPPLLYAPTSTPPTVGYRHLAAAEIRNLLNVPAGASASGVRLAIVDTGFADHPFYAQQIDFHEVPGGPARGADTVGHGTAITWNAVAVAPDVSAVVLGYSAAIQDAVEIAAEDEHAQIISCSWGWDHEQVFPVIEASIRSVVEDDKVVVLVAAGNGQISWPSSMREVISVGGVFADPASAFALEASTYASGFASSMYPGRNVPDLSGLCGQAPRGIYFAMPCPEGCELDRAFSGGAFPDGDETAADDGWIGSSGTSSATPQVAAVVALMLAKARAANVPLDPVRVKDILTRTAKPVTRGRNALGFSAAAGHPNVACGHGLVDAEAALNAV